MYKVKKFVKSSLSYCSFDSTFQTSLYYHKVGILMETHAKSTNFTHPEYFNNSGDEQFSTKFNSVN